MSVNDRPAIRFHRVTTRRRSLRALQCPLEPELLVAEFAGELPPDVALAVREHIVVCETCGARSRALRAPYELLASLGNEPVHYVPDLRDMVRLRVGSRHVFRSLSQAMGALKRGSALGLTIAIGAGVLVVLLIVGMVITASAQTVTRSANHLTSVPSAAPSGTLYAQTDKLVTVVDPSGSQWEVAEVIAVSQRDGSVLRSLPASKASLTAARPEQLPRAVALAPDGSLLVELLPAGQKQQGVLVAFDSVTGSIRFITQLKLPGGKPLASGSRAVSLTFAPDGTVIYVGLTVRRPAAGGVRVLLVNTATGAILSTLDPVFTATIPMPPPPGSLPPSSFPSLVPYLDASSLTAAQGAGGSLVVSPDGQWLFDVLVLSSGPAPSYGVLRRISTVTGQTAQELALPGDFTLAQLAINPSTSNPGVFLVKGSPDAHYYVLDAGAQGPTLLSDISLGGPSAPGQTTFTGTLSISSSADGARLYIAQDVSAGGELVVGHDRWVVDVRSVTSLAHRFDATAAGAVLSNGVGGDKTLTFILQQGQVLVTAPDLSGAITPWLSLGDGHTIVRLIASVP
jgi:hypothetical protein